MLPSRPQTHAFLVVAVVALAPAAARAADAAAIRAAIAKASTHLVEKAQADDGSFSAEVGPAVTALVVTALVRTGTPADAPAVKKGIDYLLSFRRPDGAIAAKDSPVANYETSIALMALVACNGDGRYDREVKEAEAFLKGLQWDDGEGKGAGDTFHGGAGYGKKTRPDLSNTSFFIEALRAAGASADDPAIQKALVFVSHAEPRRPGERRPLRGAEREPRRRGRLLLHAGGWGREPGRRAA